MALTPAEAGDLVHDFPDMSPRPAATTYVVLMHGDFNDASGSPMSWGVATGKVGVDVAATVFAARPEVKGHSWSALDLPSPQASP